jgi:lipid A 3-O-deacylase
MSRALVAFLASLSWCLPVAADDEAAEPAASSWPLLLDISAEYYLPTKTERHIDSVFLNAMIGTELVEVVGLDIYGGVTLTGAWGDIVQLDERFRDVRFGTRAFGAGPAFLLRLEPLRFGGFSFAADMLGAIIFYDRDFPPGGDFYNLSWRIGGTLSYEIADGARVELGARWMHVSNGQGLGPFNPSYEGACVLLGVQLEL